MPPVAESRIEVEELRRGGRSSRAGGALGARVVGPPRARRISTSLSFMLVKKADREESRGRRRPLPSASPWRGLGKMAALGCGLPLLLMLPGATDEQARARPRFNP